MKRIVLPGILIFLMITPCLNLPAQDYLPDLRNLLYWSPEIRTDQNGKKTVSFYTADLPGKYGIVIQGITANGLTGTNTVTFTVTK